MMARLSADLQLKHNRKRIEIVKGDTVQVMRGEFKGVEGEVTSIHPKVERLSIDGVTREKADGSTMYYPVHPSKVQITKMLERDPWRAKIMERRRPLDSMEINE